MHYQPSEEVKGKGVHYEGISERVPWVIADGPLRRRLTDTYKLRNRKDILDIGCGNGMTLEYFDGAETLAGIDLNDYLNVPSKDRIEFSVVDLNFDRLPYENESKDLVFAFQVIEHLENPFLVVREVARILKPGGLFIYSVPNAFTLASRLRYLLLGNVRRWSKKNDHLLFLTSDVRDKTYGRMFKTESVHYQKGIIPFIGRLIGRNLKVLPRCEAFSDSVCYVLRKR